ncbi:MAG: hypothetical protein ACRDLQ_05310 [Solirubrobacterales bacterium]
MQRLKAAVAERRQARAEAEANEGPSREMEKAVSVRATGKRMGAST